MAVWPPDGSGSEDPSDNPVLQVLDATAPAFERENGSEERHGSSASIAVWTIAHQALANKTATEAIHHLFSIGLDATNALSISDQPAVRERLQRLISETDVAIKDLRLAIFSLQGFGDESSLRSPVE